MVGAPGSSRRSAYVSINHLLNFEVISSKGGSNSDTPRRPLRHGPKPGANFTKSRFIHANFRFVALSDIVKNQDLYSRDSDAPLDWNEIELVIVPAQYDVTCPICLDTPLAPRLTKCGHFFCWPCILRYAAVNSTSGSGNWRKCPICFESINVKHLCSVRFSQVEDYASQTSHISEVGIPMTLLRGEMSTCKVMPVSSSTTNTNTVAGPTKLEDLSSFERISFVSRQFVADNVILYEKHSLQERLNENKTQNTAPRTTRAQVKDNAMDIDDIRTEDDEAENRIYVELALTMVDDRLSNLGTGKSPEILSPPTMQVHESPPLLDISPKSQPALSPLLPLFFHQSADGQPYFLCPLSIKILRSYFGTYDALPHFLCAPILEIEMAIMTEELRKRYKYLHHLPLGCQFGLCEVDLTNIVPPGILEGFSEEIESRAATRRYKAKKEAKMAAEAHRRAQERQYQHMEDEFDGVDYGAYPSRSASPGVASALFFGNDYENFPLPSQSHTSLTGSIPIITPPTKVGSGAQMAGSFASIAATSPSSEGFVLVQGKGGEEPKLIPGEEGPSSSAFAFSFDEIVLPTLPPSSSSYESTSSSTTTSSTALEGDNNTTHRIKHNHHQTMSPGSHGRKGKKMLLVSNVSRRFS